MLPGSFLEEFSRHVPAKILGEISESVSTSNHHTGEGWCTDCTFFFPNAKGKGEPLWTELILTDSG